MNVELPQDWKWVKLGDITERISNGANAAQFEDKVGYPISRIETIWNEQIDLGRVKYIRENEQAFVDKYSLKKDDVLFSHINSDLHLGKTAIYKNQTSTLIHGINLLLIRFKEDISADFINYQFKYKRRKGEFIAIAQKSVNQSSINQSKLKNLDFILPPLNIQHQTVTKIEELFSEIDKGVEELKAAQEQLKVYRQAVLKWTFEGKLTNGDVKDGELPEGWIWAEINDIGKVKGGKRLPPKHSYSTEPTEFIYIMAGNLKDGTVKYTPTYINEETYSLLSNYKVDGGEVYITIVGACIGDAGIIPKTVGKAILTENAAKIIDLKNISNEYLAKWLNSHACQLDIKRNILSATLGKLALSRISTLKVPLPPIEEQGQIVQEIESRLSVCDKIEETIINSLQQAEALRQSILKKAFEGKLA